MVWFTDRQLVESAAPVTYRRPKVLARPLVRCCDGELHQVTIEVRHVRCGKLNCSTCRDGPGHGPYVFHKYRSGGQVRSDYIGKFHEEEASS